MLGTNGDDDMSSSAHSAGSRLLLGKGDLTKWVLLEGGWSWQSGGEKLSMDSNRARLLSCLGGDWRPYYARLHFFCTRRHWLLRMRPTTTSGIPADLSTFIPVTTVIVPA